MKKYKKIIKIEKRNIYIGIIGLGYIGLPIAIEFAKKFRVLGFDKDKNKINFLSKKKDPSNQINKKNFNQAKHIKFSYNLSTLENCNIFIICVPTPINKYKKPNLKNISDATKIVAKKLKKNDIVIYESTVFPGLTENFCVPILEKISKLKYNSDFFCGYSPERINPGDKNHTLVNTIKLTSGSTPMIADYIDRLYKTIIKAGTFKVSSLKIAEAAKVIENTQRDINVAFINELTKIFNKMNLNTYEILKAANTKWNFLNFEPGLVGGHCIGVDPYYLTYVSKLSGYKPNIILAGRKVNDSMGRYAANKLISEMKAKDIRVKKSNILIMGATFKENFNDIRNSKVFDIIKILVSKKCIIDLYDPYANLTDVKLLQKFNLVRYPKKNFYDALIIAVSHNYFLKMGKKNINIFLKKKSIFFDLKNVFKNDYSVIKL